MPEPKPIKADCYSSGERAAMQWTQALRERMFGPLLRLLTRCGVSPDHLTLISLLCGIAFCPLYFSSPPIALGFLALHVLVDGLDGPLARLQGIASRRGSFTDTTSDQIVVAASTITLMWSGMISALPGGSYIFTYTIVVAFAMVRNAMNTPYSWVIRPRFLVYIWILVETYAWPGTIDYLLWGCNIVLGMKMVSGFFQIREKL